MVEHINDSWSDDREKIREVIYKTNVVMNGGGKNSGVLTLEANAGLTVVMDNRVSINSTICLTPKTANAAIAQQTLYFDMDNKEFTIIHTNNAQTDRTFRYSISGS